MPPARRRRGRSCLLALSVTAVLLVGIEGLLRWASIGAPALASPFGPDLALGSHEPLLVPDDELHFRLRPHSELLGYYRLNAHGWRGPEVAGPKPAQTLRIACTGDSTTFGIGVPEHDMWTSVLQRLLAAVFEGERQVEVLSAGVPSYSTAQNRVQVRRDLPALGPDVVVLLATGHNDAVMTAGPTDAELQQSHRGLGGALRSLALVRALHLADDAAAVQRPRPRVSLEELRDNLRDIAAAVREDGSRLLLVVPAHSARLLQLQPAEGVAEEVVQRFARSEQPAVALADPRRDFAALAPRELFLDGVHPDATGHRLIAISVAEALCAEDGPLGDQPRAAFARAWLAARRTGVIGRLAALAGSDVPPRFASQRASHADSEAFLLALHASDLGVTLPLIRSADAPQPQAWAEALLRLCADTLPAGTHPTEGLSLEERAALLSFAEQIATQVLPRDPLALLLWPERKLAPDPALESSPPPTAASATAPAVPRPRPAPEALALARALVAFEALLDIAPRREDRRLTAAGQHLRAGDADRALALLDEVLALNPLCAEAYYQRGSVLDRLARRDESQAAYARALALAPDSAVGQFLKGKSAWRSGQPEAAETALRAAVALDPALVLARYALGQVLLEGRRFDEAEQQLRIVLALSAGDFSDVPALLQQVAAQRAMAQ